MMCGLHFQQVSYCQISGVFHSQLNIPDTSYIFCVGIIIQTVFGFCTCHDYSKNTAFITLEFYSTYLQVFCVDGYLESFLIFFEAPVISKIMLRLTTVSFHIVS